MHTVSITCITLSLLSILASEASRGIIQGNTFHDLVQRSSQVETPFKLYLSDENQYCLEHFFYFFSALLFSLISKIIQHFNNPLLLIPFHYFVFSSNISLSSTHLHTLTNTKHNPTRCTYINDHHQTMFVENSVKNPPSIPSITFIILSSYF